MLTAIDIHSYSPDTAIAVRALAWPHKAGNVQDPLGFVPALEEMPTR
jgi:hypothetical protein